MTAKPDKQLIQRCVPAQNEDDVTALFEQLRLNNAVVVADKAPVSPSDFVSLQSIRCSALARRPNTTMKFSSYADTLLSDLLNRECTLTDDKLENKAEQKKEDHINTKNEETKSELESTEKKDVITLEKASISTEHEEIEKKTDETTNEKAEVIKKDKESEDSNTELLPRGPVRNARNYGPHHHPYPSGELQYGTAALTTVQDFTALSNFGGGYECGITWEDSPDRAGCLSQSSTPDTMSDQGYSSSSPILTSPGIQIREKHVVTQKLTRECKELPDTLVDFILTFSHTETDRPKSNNSAYNESPEGPLGCQSGPTTPHSVQNRSVNQKGNQRTACFALRSSIPRDKFEEAWAWALVNQEMILENKGDTDGDTLLHILVSQQDNAKVYAAIEHLRKHDVGINSRQYDKPNKNNETPLYIAVLQGNLHLVNYFLELGVDTNIRSYRGDQDSPLHNAAARGNFEIVKSLCNHSSIDINKVNARGQTPLLCAIRSHGAIDEESSCKLDNSDIIKFLLKKNADSAIADHNGRTIVHYIIETGEPELLDLLRRNVDDGKVTTLVNQEDYSGICPMKMIHNIPNVKDRTAMVLPMLTCGAGLL